MTTYVTIEGGYDGYTWKVDDNDIKASGYAETEAGAWHAAHRRVRKIRRLASTLDVKSLVDSVE